MAPVALFARVRRAPAWPLAVAVFVTATLSLVAGGVGEPEGAVLGWLGFVGALVVHPALGFASGRLRVLAVAFLWIPAALLTDLLTFDRRLREEYEPLPFTPYVVVFLSIPMLLIRAGVMARQRQDRRGGVMPRGQRPTLGARGPVFFAVGLATVQGLVALLVGAQLGAAAISSACLLEGGTCEWTSNERLVAAIFAGLAAAIALVSGIAIWRGLRYLANKETSSRGVVSAARLVGALSVTWLVLFLFILVFG